MVQQRLSKLRSRPISISAGTRSLRLRPKCSSRSWILGSPMMRASNRGLGCRLPHSQYSRTGPYPYTGLNNSGDGGRRDEIIDQRNVPAHAKGQFFQRWCVTSKEPAQPGHPCRALYKSTGTSFSGVVRDKYSSFHLDTTARMKLEKITLCRK